MYDIGDGVRIIGTFTDLDGAAADPSAVTAAVVSPSGTSTAPSVTKSATGVYYFDLQFTESGDYRCRMVATGAIKAASAWRRLSVRVSR